MASFPSPPLAAAAAAAPPRLAPGLPLAAAAVRRPSSLARRSSIALTAPANPLRCTHRRAVSPRLRRRTEAVGAASAAIGSLGEEREGCLSCFPRSRRRGRPGLARFAPCALPHTSGLSSLHSGLTGAKIRRRHILHAAGPDEPHVASPTWSETALDKHYVDQPIGKEELEGFLNTPLPSHPKLVRGQLKNGLRYLILPNKVPANRFEAHMEVHVGSIDEEEDEQGIAHMIEHVAFLGSKKREKLLGTGARSNAYTDFHHTVFHIHSPTKTKEYGEDLLPSVLDALNEVRRLKEFGVTMGEMTRYMDALIKDSEQLAMMIDSVPSVDNLDFIMESDALSHTVMDQLQGHESLLAVAETVTLEEVNTVGAEVLEFISDYGKPDAPLPAAIVACVPKKVHMDGVGETDFEIHPEEITDSIKAGLEEPIYPEPELEVPKELITQSELEDLKLQRKPSFASLSKEENVVKIFDDETGIAQCRLSNGISINYKITQNEARVGVMRLIVGGGRATEDSESKGSVIVGVRTLSEGGCVGNFSREQFRFALRDNGMRAAFQLLHMVLEHNVWLEDAFDRATQLYLSYYRSIPKSLERSTAHKLMLAMLNHDERFVEPSPHSLQKLTLQSVKDAVMNQFVGDNMEVSIVGDFTEEEVESCVLDYLGTVSAPKSSKTQEHIEKISFLPFPSDLHFQQVYIKDTDERACAYIAGPAPNRWGFATEGNDLFNVIRSSSGDAQVSESANTDLTGRKHIDVRSHSLFFGITLSLLAEIINSRLFTTVRDSMGLTYDVSFELNLFDKLDLGWYVIAVTSTPSKVHKAVDACKGVLRGLHSNKIVERELDRAKRTLLMKHEAETKTNAYWLGLLAHLQSSSVPRKLISCIKELTMLYESATIEDLYLAYEHLKVDESSLFACIGIAGAESGEEMTDDELDMGLHGMGPIGGRGIELAPQARSCMILFETTC
uniref:Peptidase M16 N-terminal domain-containing protein n=1 Tax=Oryza meridionalis TaxID=40149 RepID=A0A0E0C8Z7_9ORYZ